jgi:tRNA(fMet)-specific endonuclease VapC
LKFLLDTDTLIYVYKRTGRCLERLSKQSSADVALSTINLFELEFGMAGSTDRAPMDRYLRSICSRFAVLDFDRDASRHAGETRAHLKKKGTPIGPYDVQIAGIALANKLIVVTRNVREFARVPGLRVENWYD